MSVNTTPATFAASEVVTSTKMNTEIRDFATGLQEAWDTYTPTWTATTTNPAIGNGTLEGRYYRQGKTVHFSIRIVFGSTTTVGSGTWIFSLPVTHRQGASGPLVAQARLTGNLVRHGIPASGTTFQLYDAAGTAVTNATAAWAAGNVLSILGSYEAA